jgi:hypothetical protein
MTLPPLVTPLDIAEMTFLANAMLKDALDAFVCGNTVLARGGSCQGTGTGGARLRDQTVQPARTGAESQKPPASRVRRHRPRPAGGERPPTRRGRAGWPAGNGRQKKVRLENGVPENLTLFADSQRLFQALNNLVENGIKYGVECVRVSATNANGELDLCVEDDGPGIPPRRANESSSGSSPWTRHAPGNWAAPASA